MRLPDIREVSSRRWQFSTLAPKGRRQFKVRKTKLFPSHKTKEVPISTLLQREWRKSSSWGHVLKLYEWDVFYPRLVLKTTKSKWGLFDFELTFWPFTAPSCLLPTLGITSFIFTMSVSRLLFCHSTLSVPGISFLPCSLFICVWHEYAGGARYQKQER